MQVRYACIMRMWPVQSIEALGKLALWMYLCLLPLVVSLPCTQAGVPCTDHQDMETRLLLMARGYGAGCLRRLAADRG